MFVKFGVFNNFKKYNDFFEGPKQWLNIYRGLIDNLAHITAKSGAPSVESWRETGTPSKPSSIAAPPLLTASISISPSSFPPRTRLRPRDLRLRTPSSSFSLFPPMNPIQVFLQSSSLGSMLIFLLFFCFADWLYFLFRSLWLHHWRRRNLGELPGHFSTLLQLRCLMNCLIGMFLLFSLLWWLFVMRMNFLRSNLIKKWKLWW